MTGSGSKIEVADALLVAVVGQANLNILDGATVSSNFVSIAEGLFGATPNGNVLISGTNSQLTVNTFIPLGSNTNPDAIASLTVQDGGKLTVAGDIGNQKSSTISGDGTIELGGVFFNYGTVAPGTSFIGDLAVDGNFSQFDTGRLSLDIAGTTTDLYEQLFVSGDLFFDGALRLSFIDGFSPSVGDEFLNLITFGGENFGSSDLFDVTFNIGNIGFEKVIGTNSIGIRITDIEAVPEPLTILGAGTALGFGATFKRKLAKKTNKK